jgi:hypothetical protein
MFVAMTDEQLIVPAFSATHGEYLCPECRDRVRLKAVSSSYMRAHFAHVVGSSCGGPESHEHLYMKFWYIDQLQTMGAKDIAYERRVYVEDDRWRQPDVAFSWQGRRYAIEVQRSRIDDSVILERSNDLMRSGFDRVFWVICRKWVDEVGHLAGLHVAGSFAITNEAISAPMPRDMVDSLGVCFWVAFAFHRFIPRHRLVHAGVCSEDFVRGFDLEPPDFVRSRTERLIGVDWVERVSKNRNDVWHVTIQTPTRTFVAYLTYLLHQRVLTDLADMFGYSRFADGDKDYLRTVTYYRSNGWWRITGWDDDMDEVPVNTCAINAARIPEHVCVDSCEARLDRVWAMVFGGTDG